MIRKNINKINLNRMQKVSKITNKFYNKKSNSIKMNYKKKITINNIKNIIQNNMRNPRILSLVKKV